MAFGGFGDLSDKTTIKQYFEDPQYFRDSNFGDVKTGRLLDDYKIDREDENNLFLSDKNGYRFFAKVNIINNNIGI